MDQSAISKIKTLAVINADKRCAKIDKLDFAISAEADYFNGLVQGFEDGARWAFLERMTVEQYLYLMNNGILNKACEWLRTNAHFFVSEFSGDMNEKELVEEFRKAMEEEYENSNSNRS